MVFSDIYPETSPFPLPPSLPPSLAPSSSLFHGLASPCAVDQRSIVGSDSMDDAEAAGVERGGGIVVVELSPPPWRSTQKEMRCPRQDLSQRKRSHWAAHWGKKSTTLPLPLAPMTDISSGSVFSNATVYLAFLETLIFPVDHVRSILAVVSFESHRDITPEIFLRTYFPNF